MSAERAGWTVAVIGGDRRTLEIMRQARAAGARVQRYEAASGAPETAATGASPSRAEAVTGARLIVCPVPGLGTDDSLYAPSARENLFMTGEVLRGAAPAAMMFMGRVSPRIAAWAEETPVTPIRFGDDDPLAVLHAVPAAEALGRKVIWARGQAGTAPKRTAYNEWQVIMRTVRERVPELSRA